MAVLILSDAQDEHAQHMFAYLQTQGEAVEFLDSSEFPHNVQITWEPRAGEGALVFADGHRVPFSSIHAVYWRAYGEVTYPPLPDPEQALIAANDSRSLFESLFHVLDARWVNGWDGFHLHQVKPAALARVARLGVRVPDTVITNEAQAVLDFARRHRRCIFKPVQGGAFTERLQEHHLTDPYLANLVYAPVTVQEEIEGLDVRAFVAGDQVYACEIHSSTLDFRDDPSSPMNAIELSSDMKAMCLKIAETVHLIWSGIDFRRTPSGEYVFLEANPSPMFMGFAERTDLPLAEALAGLLRSR